MSTPRVGTPNGAKKPKKRRVAPAAGWVTKDFRYDPAHGFREEDRWIKTDEYLKRFNVKADTPAALEATMLAPVQEGRLQYRLRPYRVTSLEGLRRFYDSDLGKSKRLLEAHGNPFDVGDPEMGSQAMRLINQNEFIPLLGGPYYKQLYQYDYLLMHGQCFQMSNHSALAAAAIKILTRFVIGRGLTFTIKDEQCRTVWNEFWDRNDMKNKARQEARDISWQGELMLRFYERKAGYLTMIPVDASSCWEVVTDPEYVDQVYYYHFQWPAPYQTWVSGSIPITQYFIQQVPPTNIQHIKLNISAQERRGRSDLLPVLPWIKRFDDFYDGQTMKAILEANLVWKLKILGDDADIEAIMNDPRLTTLPPPGGVWAENEAVNLEPLAASLTSSRGSTGIGQQLANIVFAGLNLPGDYANIENGGAARATALVRTDPSTKTFEDRQQILRESFENVYDRVMEAALREKRITPKAAASEPEVGKGDPDNPRSIAHRIGSPGTGRMRPTLSIPERTVTKGMTALR